MIKQILLPSFPHDGIREACIPNASPLLALQKNGIRQALQEGLCTGEGLITVRYKLDLGLHYFDHGTPFHPSRYFQSHKIQESRRDIRCIETRFRCETIGITPRPTEKEGNTQCLLVEYSLLHPAVTEEHFTMVGREHEDRIFSQMHAFEGGNNPTDVPVEQSRHEIISTAKVLPVILKLAPPFRAALASAPNRILINGVEWLW